MYVRRISIHFSLSVGEFRVPYALSKLENVHTLSLIGMPLFTPPDTLDGRDPCLLPKAFPKVKAINFTLPVTYICVNNIVELLRAFPALSSVRMGSGGHLVRMNGYAEQSKLSLSAGRGMPTITVRRLVLKHPDYSVGIAEAMLMEPFAPQIQMLRLESIRRQDLNAIGRLLHAAGTYLEHLEISMPAVYRPRPDFKHTVSPFCPTYNTHLSVLRLEADARQLTTRREDFLWLIPVLTATRSPLLSVLSITCTMHTETDVSLLDWDRLDAAIVRRALEAPQLRVSILFIVYVRPENWSPRLGEVMNVERLASRLPMSRRALGTVLNFS
ncbi:hypothetical protein SCP_1101770 [Sparassis crispa]|uniref:F-box domain-containing protein n=1 Tax=Sparassis crispa TaxID=139825 RepID=A0A401GZC6_9APHY|nr:hypothetical protein SCP_1101770 [Sparassis crispa]GBE87500.1 hypothetical protein SCP_1101770 [Sparassis crispa]